MKRFHTAVAGCLLALFAAAAHGATTYELDVLPADHTVLRDSVTGATLTFLTTHTASSALYFHEHSWLADGSMIIFRSRALGLAGYLTATGELVRITTPQGSVGGPTCAAVRNSIFCVRNGQVLELTPEIEISDAPDRRRSRVTISEQVIAEPGFGGQLNPSCDDSYVSLARGSTVFIIGVESGEVREVCSAPDGVSWAGHLQWSRTDPNFLSFAADSPRIWVVDIREGVPRAPYSERTGELVTHESWWVNDQILFCGALRPGGQDQSHVKVLDPSTGLVRVAGAGAWWPGATASELAERNWWHCAGSSDGRWIVADNWHGTLMLFEGTTTRPRLLTAGHRTYGRGTHPEPGWDREGRQVIFSSHMLSDEVNACVADIPDAWQETNPAPVGR